MTFVRVTRDTRGYETTLLLHSPRPGEQPRVLYWYRTAPGVRVGRRPLDEDAIRRIEEQHPEIEFDWPQLLDEAQAEPVEAERRPERRRKTPKPPMVAPPLSLPAPPVRDSRPAAPDSGPGEAARPPAASTAAPAAATRPRQPSLLDQLVGREIAARLRGRHDEVAARLQRLPVSDVRAAWERRVEALDPDRWDTPDAILHGVQHADRLFDELKRELPAES